MHVVSGAGLGDHEKSEGSVREVDKVAGVSEVSKAEELREQEASL